MKNKIAVVALSLLLTLSFVKIANAQFDWLPKPGITPDSPFHFIERWSEKVAMFFTFSAEGKTERALRYAEKRLAEIDALTEKDKTELIEATTERYEEYLNMAQNKIREQEEKGKSIEEVSARVAEATSKHLGFLEMVLEKAPEQARPALERAREESKTGHITSVRALTEQNPERAVQIISESVKERLEKAKQEMAQKREGELNRTLGDYEDLEGLLEEIQEKKKEILERAGAIRVEKIDTLDELEERAKDFSAEIEEKVLGIKVEAQERLEQTLKELAESNPEKAMELNLKAAETKLNRARAKAEEGKTEEVEKLINELENQYRFGEEISQIAQGLGKDITTVEQLVEKATSVHLEVLNEVYERVPEEAKESIERAIEASVTGHQKATESLKQKGILEDIEDISEKIPAQIREKVEERVQETIQREGVGLQKGRDEEIIDDEVVCAQDAKQCPDGSWVGRNPELNCDFDPCPTEVISGETEDEDEGVQQQQQQQQQPRR